MKWWGRRTPLIVLAVCCECLTHDATQVRAFETGGGASPGAASLDLKDGRELAEMALNGDGFHKASIAEMVSDERKALGDALAEIQKQKSGLSAGNARLAALEKLEQKFRILLDTLQEVENRNNHTLRSDAVVQQQMLKYLPLPLKKSLPLFIQAREARKKARNEFLARIGKRT